ncbi:MAG: rhodanese-like domain-containing protein [Ruminococcus sp.]|nr:rhodanese-like domain-containing protein [Ruminococcus sp.]
MKKLLVIVCIVLISCSCSKSANFKYSSNEEIEKLMQENDFLIVDVRTKEEYDESHLKEAINIPYDTIDEDTILDSTKLIFVYCRSGKRSNIAYTKLKSMGYNVYDLGALDKLDLERE